MRNGTVTVNWKNMVQDNSKITTQGSCTDWHNNDSSSMTSYKEDQKEDPQYTGSQDPHPGSNGHTVTEGMTEQPAPAQGTEASSENPSFYTGEISHHTGQRNKVIYINSEQ